MRAKQVCSVKGCRAAAARRGRCPMHAAEAERARGSGWVRYGPEHRAVRPEVLARLLGTLCPRCGLPMHWDPTQVGGGLQLGHTKSVRDGNTGPGDRLEHSRCGSRHGGESAHGP